MLAAKTRLADRYLADQLRRAVTSIALGSANEAKVALRIAVAWGYVAQDEVDEIFAIIDRVGAMTWSDRVVPIPVPGPDPDPDPDPDPALTVSARSERAAHGSA